MLAVLPVASTGPPWLVWVPVNVAKNKAVPVSASNAELWISYEQPLSGPAPSPAIQSQYAAAVAISSSGSHWAVLVFYYLVKIFKSYDICG